MAKWFYGAKYGISRLAICHEWQMRVVLLVRDRGMTMRAAETIVDAAMFGIGCLEGEMRELRQREKNNDNVQAE